MTKSFDWHDFLLLAGLAAVGVAVYMLAGFAWTLLLTGLVAIAAAIGLEAQRAREDDEG
jgi:small-conductance mechanosensitive channel